MKIYEWSQKVVQVLQKAKTVDILCSCGIFSLSPPTPSKVRLLSFCSLKPGPHVGPHGSIQGPRGREPWTPLLIKEAAWGGCGGSPAETHLGVPF